MSLEKLFEALCFFALMTVGIACICVGMLTEGPIP